MAKKDRPSRTTLDDVPDKLLEIIFLKLNLSLCLIHAAATCKRWRRLVADRRFLERVDRIHHGPVAGSYRNRASPGCSPVFVPASTPPPLVDSRHFSLDFLPDGNGCRSCPWELVDSAGSVLLFVKRKRNGWRRRCFPDLLVCEPVTRRYRRIPRMEEMKHHRCTGAFLRGSDSMSGFMVVCMLYDELMGLSDGTGFPRACVFSCHSDGGGWRHAMEHGTSIRIRSAESVRYLGRATTTLFWRIEEDGGKALLSYGNGYLSIFSLPELIPPGSSLRVIDHDSDKNQMRVVCLHGTNLSVFGTWRHGRGDDEWVLLKSLDLTEAARGLAGYREEYFGKGILEIVAADVRFVFLGPSSTTKAWMFSVDLDTMEVAECPHKGKEYVSLVSYPCELPWLPPLRACKVLSCTRYRMGRCSHICICS